jgi:hypothetical protein
MKTVPAVSIRRLSGVCVLILVSIAHILGCRTEPPHSDSPVLQVFRQWLDAFNSGDSNRIAMFWRTYQSSGTDAPIEDDLDLRHITGTMKIRKLEGNTGTHLVAVMQEESGGYSISRTDLASVSPPVLGRMQNHPIPQIARSDFAAASDGTSQRESKTTLRTFRVTMRSQEQSL